MTDCPTVEIPRADAEEIIRRIFEAQELLKQEDPGSNKKDDPVYSLLELMATVLDSALEGV